MVLVSTSSGNKYARNCFHSRHFFTAKSGFKVRPSATPLKVGPVLGLGDRWRQNRNTRKRNLVPTRISCNILFGFFWLQVFSSNSARLSAAWESMLLWLIWIWKNGLQSCDSQMAENRTEFELNTSSSKTPNNLSEHGHEIHIDRWLLLRVFRFLRHQLRGVAELRTKVAE